MSAGRRHFNTARACAPLRSFALAAAIVSLFGPPSFAQQVAPDSGPATAGTRVETGPVTGQRIPRFVSLKSDEVNMRTGPGKDYPAQWVYRRAGLPVEVLKELDTWRQVRDSDGVTGWIGAHLLSNRRTALVQPWDVKAGQAPPQVPLRDDDSESGRTVVLVEAGVIANVHGCDSRWCEITVGEWRGYIEQKRLWGVYQGETLP